MAQYSMRKDGDMLDKLSRLVQKRLELPSAPDLEANLSDLGLDSVLVAELSNDIKSTFSVSADLFALDESSTLGDLVNLIAAANTSRSTQQSHINGTAHKQAVGAQRAWIHGSVNMEKPRARGVGALSPSGLTKRAGVPMETVVWKHDLVNNLEFCADIYYPILSAARTKVLQPRPIALLLHGGGHILFTRKEIPMKHVNILIKRGFLPVSIDYRLCPEVDFLGGPVADSVDALEWARSALPFLERARPDIQVDGNKALVVGWSSGGHLAMAIAYAAREKGVRPPDAVVSFYGASDLEADCTGYYYSHPSP